MKAKTYEKGKIGSGNSTENCLGWSKITDNNNNSDINHF